jgi:hypothetical protein
MAERIVKDRMEAALRGNQPSDALAILARALKAEGMSQRAMYELFDEYRAKHEDDADETRHEAILDNMDTICGYCYPHQRLFDGSDWRSNL